MLPTVRPAAVAGWFYPADAVALRELTTSLLAGHPAGKEVPKAVIAPHAGYAYSGDVAAAAYALIAPARDRIRRVVLLGPAHRVAFRGLAAPKAPCFETPLGRVPVDQAALAELDGMLQVRRHDLPHAAEHSIEVQLPFLQCALDDFSTVPLVIGDAAVDDVTQVLERLWGGDETLVVVSSDLSHDLPYRMAQAVDRATADRILALDSTLHGHQACGATGIAAALQAARARGLVPRLVDLRNSGDTAGDRARVVGYAAFAFEGRA